MTADALLLLTDLTSRDFYCLVLMLAALLGVIGAILKVFALAVGLWFIMAVFAAFQNRQG